MRVACASLIGGWRFRLLRKRHMDVMRASVSSMVGYNAQMFVWLTICAHVLWGQNWHTDWISLPNCNHYGLRLTAEYARAFTRTSGLRTVDRTMSSTLSKSLSNLSVHSWRRDSNIEIGEWHLEFNFTVIRWHLANDIASVCALMTISDWTDSDLATSRNIRTKYYQNAGLDNRCNCNL